MKNVFPNWKDVNIDFHWRGLVAVTTKFSPSIGKLDGDEIYYSFGYQANGVNTAPWSGNELAKLIHFFLKLYKLTFIYRLKCIVNFNLFLEKIFFLFLSYKLKCKCIPLPASPR